MFHYVQTDIRDPLLRDFPGASGSWNCHPVAGLRGNDISIGGSGAVVVPPGEHYECTAVNATSLLTVDKTVLPEGAAEPGSFEFELTAIPPIVVDDPNELRFPAGQEQTVVPNQQYSLAEIAQPDFQLTQLECVSDAGDAVPIADLVLAPGDTATCAAVNQLGSWTAVKSSDPPSGTSVAPGDVIRYTVTAIQLFEGGVSTDVVITDDLVDVLDDATVVEGSVSATSGTVEQVGDTRVWTIPSLTGTEELTFEVRVNDDAWDATLDNVVTIAGDGGVDCADASFEEDCDETHHTTPDPPPTPTPTPTPPVPSLPATGANSPDALLLSALAALLIGAALLRVSRRERARRSRAQT
nr:LPXTG cell wall anchor domain-containing protein [Microbacterium ulmi]